MKALITGVTGQDGSYLSELLLERGYEVHGIQRRSSSFNTGRIDHLRGNPKFTTHYGDVTDFASVVSVLSKSGADEVYHLAAQSHVGVSFEVPEYTGEVDALGTLRLLEAMRCLGVRPRFYNASTSEIFGDSPPPQNELTPFHPRSPYGCAKLYSHWMTRNYREAYGYFACSGILFNHESPRRGENFVSRKIVRGVTDHVLSGSDFGLGNLRARRDWGHARDYVEAMFLMLQADSPEDYVISTGESCSVRDFVDKTAEVLGLKLRWDGSEAFWGRRRVVYSEARQFRPLEVPDLLGDSSKARKELGWEPKYDLTSLVREMVDEELKSKGDVK